MTSLSTIGNEPQSLEGRSVRDIVEYSPELVNEVWCRKIFRQILQSLELQYAMQMPHRAITPDTIVFHDNGEPLLAPDLADDDAVKSEADDLTALASVVHYAITSELLPGGPLRGRALEGYSDSLLTAVDRCMAPDPAERPQSIAQLREILGIVSLSASAGAKPAAPFLDDAASSAVPGPAAPAAATPGTAGTAPGTAASSTTAAAPVTAAAPSAAAEPFARRSPGLGRRQRWAIAAGGAAVLVAIALVMFADMRDSGSFDHIVLNQPQSDAQAPGPASAAPAAPQAAAGAAVGAAPGGPGASAASAPATSPEANAGAGTTGADGTSVSGPDGAGSALPVDPTRPPADGGVANAAAGAGATYRLRIQPWGAVYVDGVDRGISPPVKRLVLAPGKHTLRVTNPAFPDRVLEVDTARGGGQVMVDFNDAR
ncbi:hypothetical protein [Massilia sp. 9096]|uniref:hypothetical protein n=1 Tax=Massilia sp. 9096 TaxID=1500894 RepID=UPI00056AA2BB|nr:hypothetical protein [Massilia sp. 9096]